MALEINGSDYVDCGNDSSLDFDDTDDFTISAWIYPYTISSYNNIVSKRVSPPHQGYTFFLYGAGNIGFQIWVSGTLIVGVFKSSIIPEYTWSHLAVVYSSTLKLYVDSNLVDSAAKVAGDFSNSENVGIGTESVSSPMSYFNGIIQNVSIHNRELSEAEIKRNMYRHILPEADLKALWRLYEKSGSTVYDYSGNGNNGAFNGSPTWKEGRNIAFPAGKSFGGRQGVSAGLEIIEEHISEEKQYQEAVQGYQPDIQNINEEKKNDEVVQVIYPDIQNVAEERTVEEAVQDAIVEVETITEERSVSEAVQGTTVTVEEITEERTVSEAIQDIIATVESIAEERTVSEAIQDIIATVESIAEERTVSETVQDIIATVESIAEERTVSEAINPIQVILSDIAETKYLREYIEGVIDPTIGEDVMGNTAVQVESLWNGIVINGVIAAGYTVETYDAGTMNPKITWVDKDKVTEASNPVTLDADGKALVYADGWYKFIIKNIQGAIVATLDNLFYLSPVDASSIVNDPVKTVFADYIADKSTDVIILFDATIASFTQSLPSTSQVAVGKKYILKKIDSGSNTITIQPSGTEKMDGQASVVLSAQYDTIIINSDGSNWIQRPGKNVVTETRVQTLTNKTLNSPVMATPSSDDITLTGSPSGSPDANTLYKDNVLKGWGVYDQTSDTLRDNFNVSSVSDDATGEFTITWDTDFSNIDYAISGMSLLPTLMIDTVTPPAVGYAKFDTFSSADVLTDTSSRIIVVGDQ